MQKRVAKGTKIDFKSGQFLLRGGIVDEVISETATLVVDTVGCRHYIDFKDVRAVY